MPVNKTFAVGETATIVHTITADDITKFVELTGDDNPLHVSREYAERTSFKGIVAHGMLGASFVSTIIGKKLPGEGALWLSQSLEFLLPVRIGDTLEITGTVTGFHAGQRILDLQIQIVNQYRQTVLTGTSRVKLLEVETPSATAAVSTAQKVALVTGASRGIGAATARRLARDGYAVVVNFRADAEGAALVVDEIRKQSGTAIALAADLADERALDRLVRDAENQLGAITALVNNASGKIVASPFTEIRREDLAHQMELHYFAPLRLIQRVLPGFAAAGRGAVVNVGSIYADATPPGQLLAYTSAKAALASATRSLAVEHGPKGFRFNVVAPGMTETRLISEVPEKARILSKMQTPLRRLATPEDVANAIAFLLSDEAAHITGETLRVCGGTVML
jgi:3-oxoacyl-[acyl-carrier protein] reductase